MATMYHSALENSDYNILSRLGRLEGHHCIPYVHIYVHIYVHVHCIYMSFGLLLARLGVVSTLLAATACIV